MTPQFIRILRKTEDVEILVNINNIWKIEISYGVPNAKGDLVHLTTLEHGLRSPEAVRFYKIFVGSEVIKLFAKPESKVLKVIEGIYKNAVADE